jgi:hypothetical protein
MKNAGVKNMFLIKYDILWELWQGIKFIMDRICYKLS